MSRRRPTTTPDPLARFDHSSLQCRTSGHSYPFRPDQPFDLDASTNPPTARVEIPCANGCGNPKVYTMTLKGGRWVRATDPRIRYDNTNYLIQPGEQRVTRADCESEMFTRLVGGRATRKLQVAS